MDCRELEITLVSADNLPDVRTVLQMKVYAKISIGGELKTTQETPVDWKRKTNPRWNFSIRSTISESTVLQPGVNLNIQLFCKRTRGDKYIGEVNVPVKRLFDAGLTSEGILSYDVGGTQSGRLNILYRFGDKIRVNRPISGWREAVGDVFSVLVGGTLIFLNAAAWGGF